MPWTVSGNGMIRSSTSRRQALPEVGAETTAPGRRDDGARAGGQDARAEIALRRAPPRQAPAELLPLGAHHRHVALGTDDGRVAEGVQMRQHRIGGQIVVGVEEDDDPAAAGGEALVEGGDLPSFLLQDDADPVAVAGDDLA
ncbi:hypothetical protein SKB0092_05630 [Roseomonas mucosa]